MLCYTVLCYAVQRHTVLCFSIRYPKPFKLQALPSCQRCQPPCVNLDSTHAQLYDQPVNCCVVVLEDMLWGFMGFEGKYIKADRARSSKGGVSFVLRGKLDAAVHELVARMLPIWYACQCWSACHPQRSF